MDKSKSMRNINISGGNIDISGGNINTSGGKFLREGGGAEWWLRGWQSRERHCLLRTDSYHSQLVRKLRQEKQKGVNLLGDKPACSCGE